MILDLLYPPKCFHCKARMLTQRIFCTDCLETFELLQTEGRCTKCFHEISMISGVCTSCRQISHPFRKMGACFDKLGPAQSLLEAFDQGHFYFAKTIASYLLIQLDRLKFPPFHCLTIVPGYFHQPQIPIAKELAKLLDIPFQLILKRKLTRQPHFISKKKCNIINQKVLLLDLKVKTRETLRSAAWTLLEKKPEVIYTIAFSIA